VVAAYRPGRAEAVVARGFGDGCLINADVGAGRVVVSLGTRIKVLDARTGTELASTKVFHCGDGAGALAADGRIFATDDCDGTLVELDEHGEVVRELDLFRLDPEPMDVVSSFQYPWVVSGSWGNERLYRIDDLTAPSLAVPEGDILLSPV
jgi:hypothetical protein